MSLGVVTLQAQVESVLGELLKAATRELTQLFESRYRALEADVRLVKGETATETTETLDSLWSADTKRSVGVQVEADIDASYEIPGSSFLSSADCLGESKDVVVEGGLIPSEVLLADPEWSPPQEPVDPDQDVDVVQLSVPEEFLTDNDIKTEVVLHVSTETWTGTLDCESTKSCPEQQPIVIQPDTSEGAYGEKIKFVCPLILKTEPPEPKTGTLENPAKDEPQAACVSTAKGTAYSPSPLDGAVTPDRVGVWEKVHTPKGENNHLLMKLKLSPPDQKLLRPCAVQLVNVLTLSQSQMKVQADVSKAHSPQKSTGWPQPKDLRRHQGVHTGHRLCCFSSCGNGVWRLQRVVPRSRDGYPCNTCGKTFKRRKILRRHERFHTGQKPYACELCSKTFALRKSLRRHTRFHTGERPHSCTQCGKSFRLRDNLKSHLRFHTGEKPFSCVTCGKMFRILRNLEQHSLTQCENFVPSFRKIAGLSV